MTYHSYLETIIASNSTTKGAAKTNQSPWLYLDAADVLFKTAKRRAYVSKKDRNSRSVSVASSSAGTGGEDDDELDALREAENATPEPGHPVSARAGRHENGRNRTRSSWPTGVEPVLEELPKWRLLGSVLEEIESEMASQPVVDMSGSPWDDL